MQLSRASALIILPVAAMLVLAGCSTPSAPDAKPTEKASSSATSKPSSTGSADGEVTEPGAQVGIDEPIVYESQGTDGVTALISAELTEVTPATPDQVAFLKTQFDGGELDGYDITLIRLEMTKVSGDPVAFNSDATSFAPVDADGEKVQEATLIGWDECSSESFTEEFDGGEPITQCYVAAAPAGGKAPAGLMYDGGFTNPNPYDSYDGDPILLIKD
ncbi:hypothetical protein [Plantibacter sp. ME-Dv--P-122b]|uniref:hypothetical protein n=1 Tax=Plantibacter sp. ME-Dv--P-122b TaxID=3040300 RepID=UPI00254B56F4|nr:hypothetical protein [Plantibacter sp. ME-Dv--P-122b]